MSKQILLLTLTFSFLTLCGQSNEVIPNRLILQEDENISITLLYFSKADIGDADWLKLEIENKTDSDIQIAEANYYLNKEKEFKNGEKQIDIGAFGRGSKYDLIHYFYDLPNPSDYRDGAKIKAHNSIFAWKYLSNYAAVLMDGRSIPNKENCALFHLDFQYKLKGKEFRLICDNVEFCFDWVPTEAVSEEKLSNRLRDVILNPHYRWINTYVINQLMKREIIVRKIATKDLVQGVLLREKVMTADENILFLSELSKRNAVPNEKITTSFSKKIRANNSHLSSELQYYWDNYLLDDLLESKLHYSEIHRILEVNAQFWSTDSSNTKKIYEYLAQAVNFERVPDLETKKIKEWAVNVKLIATSRHPDFINYLKPFLDNETEFTIEDWSKYQYSGLLPKGAKPELITIRICDVAFIALLRALNQFEFVRSSKIGTKYYSLKIKDDILPAQTLNTLQRHSLSNDINLGLYERELKLTPEWKNKIN